MKDIYIDTVQAFNDIYGLGTLHPLVAVARVESPYQMEEHTLHYGVYALFLKENKGCKLSYGRTPYDFDEMTVTSFAPGQSVRVEPNPDVPGPKFTALLFHPDFLNRTNLGRNISRYEFFDYTSNEALHLSVEEIEIFRNVLSVVKKFMGMLDEYIAGIAESEGLPSVGYFADKCCYSPKYFGELVKTETGRTAKDIINDRLLSAAKSMLQDESLSIALVSRKLGFEYPQHFVRFFKARTGRTPSDFRNMPLI